MESQTGQRPCVLKLAESRPQFAQNQSHGFEVSRTVSGVLMRKPLLLVTIDTPSLFHVSSTGVAMIPVLVLISRETLLATTGARE
jgi:hypothetical protein